MRVNFSRYQLVLSVIKLLTTLQIIAGRSTMQTINVNQVRRRLNLSVCIAINYILIKFNPEGNHKVISRLVWRFCHILETL